MIATNQPGTSHGVLQRFAIIAAVLTLIRIGALVLSDADLGQDEIQYWFWSQTLDLGYFSKPPLIAWTIAATTGLFGDAAWAVRLAAPLFHLGAGGFIFVLTRRLYGETPAFWAGLGWLLLPGVSISSALITTDAPLLFFWSGALYFFFRQMNLTQNARSNLMVAVALGACLGLGFLAKYAIVYFPLAAALVFVCLTPFRARLRLAPLALAIAATLLIASPNIWWNARNDFQTLTHTAANAKWDGSFFHPFKLIEFWGQQFGVFGPFLLAGLIWFGYKAIRDVKSSAKSADWATGMALLLFTATPLIIVSAQALLSRAHGNWAAAAYPAAVVFVTGAAFRAGEGRFIRWNNWFHGAIAAATMIVITNFAFADAIGISVTVKRLKEWDQQVNTVTTYLDGQTMLLADDREVISALLFYAKDAGIPVKAFNPNITIDHHYEIAIPYIRVTRGRALYVTTYADALPLKHLFETITPLGATSVRLTKSHTRTLYLFDVSDEKAR